jgi:hypothetical protein
LHTAFKRPLPLVPPPSIVLSLLASRILPPLFSPPWSLSPAHPGCRSSLCVGPGATPPHGVARQATDTAPPSSERHRIDTTPPPSPDLGGQAVGAVSSSSTCCGTPLTLLSSRRTTSVALPTTGCPPATGTPPVAPSHRRHCLARAGPQHLAGRLRRRPMKHRVHTLLPSGRRRLATDHTMPWLCACTRVPEHALAQLCRRTPGPVQRGLGHVAALARPAHSCC